jgi:uncharacterized protein (TIGR02246 family)
MPLFVSRNVGPLATSVVVCLGIAWGARLDAAPEPAAADAARTADERAILDASLAYKQALEKGDGKALAALWTPDGDIVDDAGRLLAGRDSVAALEPPADAKAASRTAIRIHDTRVRFVADDVAIEDGTVEVVPSGSVAPLRGQFSATWVKREGGWKLAAVREARIDAPSGRGQLADLDWMVGDWVAVDDHAGETVATAHKPVIRVSARWNPTKTFLLRETTITTPETTADTGPAMQITQRIGWDPLSRSIRSWVFSSDGGHGEATWSRDDGSWVARTTAVLPDGTQTSSLNIYTYDGKDRCTWRSIPTHVGGEHMPHVNMTLVRAPSPQPTGGTGR